MTEKNYLEMTDEEILNMSPPEPTENTQQVETSDEDETTEAEVTETAGTVHNDDGEAVGGSEEGDKGEVASGGVDSDEEDVSAVDTETKAPKETPAPTEKDDGKVVEVKVDAPAQPTEKSFGEMTVEEKAAAFDRMTAPFKANGKMIETKSVEEEIKLKQMGANFTQKMQVLQPQLRIIKMLENNNLLDESKLSHLIDLSLKKPQAIQKLLVDAEFDPLSVDTDQAASYTPGNHQVSDQEMAFQSALDNIETTDTGPDLIIDIARQYDQESKQALYQNPEMLASLNQQRGNGIYAKIDSEVQRLRALGQIGAHVPYLQAYFAVGDMLHNQGKLVDQAQVNQSVEQVPVETRTAVPTQSAVQNDRAKAAAPTRTAVPTPTVDRNSPSILDIPDAEFLKQMEGRV